MKKIFATYLLYILCCSTVLFIELSCNKSDSGPANKFTWTFKDSNYVATLDTAYLAGLAPGPIILAGTGTKLNSSNFRFEISLTSLNVGTYTFGSNGNSLRYVDDDGNALNGSNGTLTITAKTNSFVTGTFSVKADFQGTLHPITGSFTNTPVKP